MDARDALRRYLEQRRDLGESELVLDSLSVEEAMRLLGAARAGSPIAPQSARAVPPASDAPTRTAPAPAQVTDWREAVRAAGAGRRRSRRVRHRRRSIASRNPCRNAQQSRRPTPPCTSRPLRVRESVASPLEDVPTGLVVGGASRALSEDPAFKLATLEEIAATVAGCRRCPLYATATNPVPGTGNPDADFMIVGEAPGANEDAQGRAVRGAGGTAPHEDHRGDPPARATTCSSPTSSSIVRPGTVNPLPEEVTACSPYLVRQIELVRPKVILALGTFAAQTLLETKLTIGKLRGQIHRYYGVPLIVTYHPAALLRNPAWKRPTWEDVQLARRILDRALAAGA